MNTPYTAVNPLAAQHPKQQEFFILWESNVRIVGLPNVGKSTLVQCADAGRNSGGKLSISARSIRMSAW